MNGQFTGVTYCIAVLVIVVKLHLHGRRFIEYWHIL